MSRRPSTFLGRDPFKLSTSSSPSPSSQSSTTKSSSSSSAPSPPPPHQRTPRRPTYIPPPRDLPKSTHPSLRHHKISAQPFTLATIPQSQHEKIPTLLPTLPPLLFRQGPTHTQCPRTGVYNVDPYLQKITPREEFDFDTLPVFRPPSKDEALRKIAKKHGGKYTVSTSSITGALGQIYRMITGCKKISVAGLSEEFLSLSRDFNYSSKMPVMLRFNPIDGVNAIDIDKSLDDRTENVLSQLGHTMEKMLTKSPEEFRQHLKGHSEEKRKEAKTLREAYHYSQYDDLVLRSQIDCHDPRLPNSKFDLKTRAVVAVRMDVNNYKENVGYRIHKLRGQFESFEREYYDMIRSAFLKYSYQCRIGKMDGIFVAYHNTDEIFGFQYIPIAEMDTMVAGNPATGTAAFQLCIKTWYFILKTLEAEWPIDKVKRVTLSTDDSTRALTLYIEEVDPKHPDQYNEKLRLSRMIFTCDSTITSPGGEPIPMIQPLLESEQDDWSINLNYEVSGPSEVHEVRAEMDSIRRDLRAFNTCHADGSPSNFMKHLQGHYMNTVPKYKGPVVIGYEPESPCE